MLCVPYLSLCSKYVVHEINKSYPYLLLVASIDVRTLPLKGIHTTEILKIWILHPGCQYCLVPQIVHVF